ncbi:hypothetical protein HQ576_19765, partial [bacterium]|nr:hypothetical protein [bacterium]
MRPLALALCLLALAWAPCTGAGGLRDRDDVFLVLGRTCTVAFSPRDGAIVGVEQAGRQGSIWRSGEHGLWHVHFRDGSEARAADFDLDSPTRSFRCEADGPAATLRMVYHSDELDVVVTVTGRLDGVDFAAEVKPRTKTVLDFALPARLRFAPEPLQRFICPANGNQSVGTAFKAAFFQEQPQDSPSGWRHAVVGPKGYAALFGGPLDQRADRDAPTALRVTDDGRAWLGAALAKRMDGAKATVNRPSTRRQVDLVLVDSANGPYFASSRLGGTGGLWRLGGGVHDREKPIALALVGATVERLMAKLKGRTAVCLVSLKQGPPRGGWADVTPREWLARLHEVSADGVAVRELTSVPEMMAALAGDEFRLILNPYGEWLPVPEPGGMDAAVAAIGRYVRAGGHWFEVGGYSFHAALRPVRYYRHGTDYPAGFADFFHIDTRAGSASVYRVQPRTWKPWAAQTDPRAIFVPGRIACGGDARGGWCDRPFVTHVPPGTAWPSPAVRLTVGNSAPDGLRAYCEANRIVRRLEDKMAPDVLRRFKTSVLVKYDGSARDKIAHLDKLPVPSQVHFSDYLKGGFDKEYPDHLPPHPHFGTAAELRELLDKCRALGHLSMPYTNPTWWCDGPKGPTFAQHGDAPLLRTLDGKLSPERYANNTGFTVCHWHPAVQAANRKTVTQFTQQFPVDILFQDQCGARRWRYDTNPASPTPFAYYEGLLSMVQEDSQRAPLSTESGWDRMANWESQLCGLSWGIVPTEGGPSWRRLMKTDYAPHTWDIFPLAQHIAHDKTAMLYHDLGQFVTNREVMAWTLGLGFCMSYRLGAASLERPATREWLRWLDRVQKSVVARYVGKPVVAFEHDRGPKPTVDDDGVIRAQYGDVRIVANLGPHPRQEGELHLAPYGFVATAPGLVAANLAKVGGVDFGDEGVSFVVETRGGKTDAWVYAAPEQQAVVLRPTDRGLEPVRWRTPARAGRTRIQPPAALAGIAPKDWPGQRPAIGVIALDAPIVWTRITPEQWLDAFRKSALHTQYGLPVRALKTPADVAAALEAGPARWLAIVNPHGESFPASDAAQWRQSLDLIKGYVAHGGCWWETGGYSFHQAVSASDSR